MFSGNTFGGIFNIDVGKQLITVFICFRSNPISFVCQICYFVVLVLCNKICLNQTVNKKKYLLQKSIGG